jgi:hypothetical protein
LAVAATVKGDQDPAARLASRRLGMPARSLLRELRHRNAEQKLELIVSIVAKALLTPRISVR